jgi:hypothetical protein
MNISQLKFDINDVVKLVGFISAVIALRYDLVSEIRSNKVMDQADKQIIDYRLKKVEDCCGQTAFIKPDETSIKSYRSVR